MHAPVRVFAPFAVLIGSCIVGCGKADPAQPTQRQSLTVGVATSGEDVDPDGYSVSIGNSEAAVPTIGTVNFPNLVAGSYIVTLTGVAPNCEVVGGESQAVVIGSTQGEHQDFQVLCESVFTSGSFAMSSCPSLSLSQSSAKPLTTISVGLLPATLPEPLFAYVRWAGSADAALSFVERKSDGTATMLAPYHPSGSMNGGQVSVRIGGSTSACPAFAFNVEALPEAPGELDAVVDLMMQAVAAQAALTGTTIAQLRVADAQSIPRQQLPILIALSVLDHPQNPNSLRALADGTAPIATGVERSTLDRALAATQLRAGLQSSLSPVLTARVNGSVQGDISDCAVASVQIAADLDMCMRIANDAAFRLDGVSGEVLGTLAGATGVLGSVPHAGAKLAAAGAGAALFAFQKLREGTAFLLPSEFVDLKVVAAPTLFREDEEGPGDWQAEVRATSKGWLLDKSVLEALSQIANLTGAYGAWLDRFADADVVADIAGFVLSQVMDRAIGTTDGSGILQIAPTLFGPIDISDEEWSERTLIPEVALVMVGHTAFDPREAGTSVLSVRTKGGRFGGRQITASPENLTVQTIQVTISPDEVIVGPGQSQEFTVTVAGSKFPEMVEIDPGVELQGAATITYNGNGTHKINYTAPAVPNVNKPDLLTVRHTAQTGARGLSTLERLDIATIRFGGIQLSAPKTCIEPGQTLQISATVAGVNNPVLTWTASAGAVTSLGLFTAPAQPSAAVITATLVSNPAVKDTIQITVGGCSCLVSLTVNGVKSTANDGFPTFYLTPNRTAIMGVSWTGTLSAVNATFGGDLLNPTPFPVGSTGSLAALGSGFLTGVGTFGSPVEPGSPKLTANIVENSGGNVLEGSLSGFVQLLANEEVFVSLVFTFRITADPIQSTPDIRKCVYNGGS